MSKIIVALDFPDRKTTLDFLDNFKNPIFVKLGMELTYSEGFELINEIKKRGHKIFLDLKLHDIPNTVKNGMKSLAKRNVDIVNLHAAGGVEMMKAAIDGLQEGAKGKRPLCIAVTQLTSTSKEVMNEELMISGKVEDIVLKYAQNAQKAGLDGVVCSVHEAKAIHNLCGDNFITVTPGIRLSGDNKDDQKRVATPEFAKEQGCDYIVVGRSITKADKPKEIFDYIERIMEA